MNQTIGQLLLIFFVPYNSQEIRHPCKSNNNLKCENQVILLMIIDSKKWHYLPALFRGKTSKSNEDFIC